MADEGPRELLRQELTEAIIESARAARRCANPQAQNSGRAQTYAAAAHELAQALAVLALKPPSA